MKQDKGPPVWRGGKVEGQSDYFLKLKLTKIVRGHASPLHHCRPLETR